jgi:hypothetical protein
VAGQAGADRDRDRDVGLAGAGRAQQHDVLLGVQEVELAEVFDHLALDRALEGEVELLERLSGGQAGGLDARFAAVRLARCDLGGEQRLGEALVAPVLLARSIGQLRQRSRRGWRLERPEQVCKLGGLRHAGISRSLAGQRAQLDRPIAGFGEAAVVLLALSVSSPATAAPVCGDTITQNTTLNADILNCARRAHDRR